MGTYSLEHIIQEWGKGKLTDEQVIGQVLLIIREVKEQLGLVEARLLRLEQAAKRGPTPQAPRAGL
jgi:hypothetical protein